MLRTIFLAVCIGFVTLLPVHGAVVSGRVATADGKAIAGAEVIVQRSKREKPLASLKTDKTGRFSVKLPANGGPAGLPSFIFAWAPGYAPVGVKLQEGQNTLTLTRSGKISGSIVDAQGQPVLGAQVRIMPYSQEDDLALASPLNLKQGAKSSADGRWTITNVPVSGTAYVSLVDPRFLPDTAQVQLGVNATMAPMVAKPAGQITGRVVFENGKPAAGAQVIGRGQDYRTYEIETRPDGAYTIGCLSTGSLDIRAHDSTGKWFSPASRGVKTTEGQVTRLPDIVLGAGSVIEGTVTDEATGKPRAGICVVIFSAPDSPYAGDFGSSPVYTDKQGHFKKNVAPGKNVIEVRNPGGDWRPEPDQTLDVAKGETRSVGIALMTEAILSGTAVDAFDEPAPPGLRIWAGVKLGENGEQLGGSAPTEANGGFVIRNLAPGATKLSLGRMMDDGEWELVKPREITLPLTAPLKLTLRKIVFAEAAGLAIAPDGKPIPGVKVSAEIIRPVPGESYAQGLSSACVSDATGRFAVPKLKAGDTINLKIEKAGFSLVSGGKVTAKGDQFSVADVVMRALNMQVAGRVVDSAGKPVSGARIGAPDGPDFTTISDVKGAFVLESLPDGEVKLIAAKGCDAGYATAKAGAGSVEIALRQIKRTPPHDLARGSAILQNVMGESKGWDDKEAPLELARYDPDLAAKMASELKGSARDYALAGIIATLARTDPARAAEWAPAKLDQIKNHGYELYAAVALGLAVAGSKPDLATALYDRARKLASEKDATESKVVEYGSLAALAGKLSDPEADAMLKRVAGLEEVTASGYLPATLTRVVALGSPELAEKTALSFASSTARDWSMSEAIREVALYDITGAKKLLAKLEELGENRRGAMSYGVGAVAIIKATRKADAAGALALARKIADGRYKTPALILTAPYLDKATALAAYQEAADASTGSSDSAVWIAQAAAGAYALDSKVGTELFDKARAQLKSPRSQGVMQTAAFAYFYSQVDPAESRLILERQYMELVKAPKQDNWSDADATSAILAMAAIDVDRALEMAQAEAAKVNGSGFRQRAIAEYVLAGESGRRDVDFVVWTRGNFHNWQSEMPLSPSMGLWDE